MMIAALFLMIAQAKDANAQRPGMDPEMRAEFARMAAQKVAGELKLDKAEREWFEPLYMEYADSLRKAQKVDLPEKNKEIKEMTDDEAIICMVEANHQRENILPSERAFSYKMQLEAMKRQAGRPAKNNPAQVGLDFCGKQSRDILAEQVGESKNQIQRYIRLTELVPQLLQMVDDKKIAFNPAVELSYIPHELQTELLDIIEANECTPSLSQAQRMKQAAQEGKLDRNGMELVMQEEKPQQNNITIKSDKLNKYFRKDATPREKEELIIKALDYYCKVLERKRQEREHER